MQNSDADILAQNIGDLQMRHELVAEQKNISIELLSEAIANTVDITPDKNHRETVDKYASVFCSLVDDPSVSDYICFFDVLIEKIGVEKLFPTDAGDQYELFSSDLPAKISYVKNTYSDTAFMRFSELFKVPKVSYGADFEETCEDVYNGACDYCILPIANSSAGKLFSFYQLIDKYDLNIFAVCDLEDGQSSKRTRYALLSRKKIIHLDPLQQSYFEFSIASDDSYSLSDILEAAKLSSLSLYRIDTLPLKYDELTFKFYHIFKGKREQALPFLIYLYYKYPQHEAIGQYISI